MEKDFTNINKKFVDRAWENMLEQLDEAIEESMNDANFKLDDLTQIIAISTSQLYRKTVKLTGLSPRMYVQQKRLVKAKELLEEGVYQTVAEVSYAVGHRHTNYFSTIFEQKYGKKPIEYLR